MLPFVSIIMPIRNEEDYISRTLDSIRQQDYPADRFEVLVVDGMSDDKTREIVAAFMMYMPNMHLYDNSRKIVPNAMNIGLKHARGEIIIRVDGHVMIEKNYISLCVDYMQRYPAACVGGIIISLNSTFWGEAIARAMSCSFGVGNSYFRVRKNNDREGYVDCLAFGAYRREIFEQIGGFDEELVRCQDDEFNYRLRKYGGKIFLTPKIRSYYFSRMRLGPLWRQYFQYGLWKIRVLQKHFSMMQIRQFVPPVFVLALTGSILLAPFWPVAGYTAIMIIASYLSVSFIFSLQVGLRDGFHYTLVLPLIFFILHVSYGLGFLLGLLKLIPTLFEKTFTVRRQVPVS